MFRHKETKIRTTGSYTPSVAGTALLVALGGLAAVAWLSYGRQQPQLRRYADRQDERRNPMHFFLAGQYPHRRKIDVSGQRPLFERRQSVYDAY